MISRDLPDLIYKSTLFISLIVLLTTSWHAPLSGDEYVHVKQAEKNINYIKTLGKDKEALNTPISRLKHYGQSFDSVTTYLAQVFNVDDLYRFRHVSNAIVAWLTILFASLIAFKISKSKITSFLTVILFLVSLRFMGHATNNLKDIPFAFSFIFSIYFMLRFLEKLPRISWIDLAWMTIGLALAISIRVGGLLIFTYYLLFSGLYLYYQFISGEFKSLMTLIVKIILLFVGMLLLAYFSAILIWPWALENPLLNPWNSLDLMHHYPTTVRQIFEGTLFWSDQFPWYYLFKYLVVTLPVIVLIGFVFGLYFLWHFKSQKSIVFSLFLLIALGFPLFYAAVSGTNVYGGWRQMLFIFPPLIVLSSLGLWMFWEKIKTKLYFRICVVIIGAILILGPVRFFIKNYPYQYTFFNQLVGGVKGAYGNYELDYYFTSYRSAYEFIDQQGDTPEIVAANFIIPEYYKGKPYKAKLIDYYDRSSVDWDYAIICNTFLDPHQLQNGYWPPSNTIFKEEVDGKPVLAILKRMSKLGLEGKQILDKGDYKNSISILEAALASDVNDESVRLNLARAYKAAGELSKARSTLDYFEELYPGNEWANELRGELEMKEGNVEDAIHFFKTNIDYNSKFFHSYINLAKALISIDKEDEAVKLLKACLRINPFYEPAYKLYGKLLIERGEEELGRKMLEYSNEGNGKYGGK